MILIKVSFHTDSQIHSSIFSKSLVSQRPRSKHTENIWGMYSHLYQELHYKSENIFLTGKTEDGKTYKAFN